MVFSLLKLSSHIISSGPEGLDLWIVLKLSGRRTNLKEGFLLLGLWAERFLNIHRQERMLALGGHVVVYVLSLLFLRLYWINHILHEVVHRELRV